MNDSRPSVDNRMRKLSVPDVIAIRRQYAEGDISFKSLGEQYGVTGQSIANIVSRSSWAWLADDEAAIE